VTLQTTLVADVGTREASARAALERLQDRAYTDNEWAAVRRELTTFARLVARWQHQDPRPVVSVAIPESLG
jgi:hypothetical protein